MRWGRAGRLAALTSCFCVGWATAASGQETGPYAADSSQGVVHSEGSEDDGVLSREDWDRVWLLMGLELGGGSTNQVRFNGELLGDEESSQGVGPTAGATLRLDWPLGEPFSLAGLARFSRLKTEWESSLGVAPGNTLGLGLAPTVRFSLPVRSNRPPPQLFASVPFGVEWVTATHADALEPVRIRSEGALGHFWGAALGSLLLSANQLAFGLELSSTFHRMKQPWIATSGDGSLRTRDMVEQKLTVIRVAALLGGWW